MVLIDKLSSDARVNVSARPSIHRIYREAKINEGVRDKLLDMFYNYGPKNGTMLSLPFDQLVEHGIGHMFSWDRAGDSRAVIELANSGLFSALVLSIGQAEKYRRLVQVPLIIKVDGHFSVGKDVPYERHSNMSSVERAVEAGADAIGLTFYMGGRETETDVERCSGIIEKAHIFGKPVFLWAYARGPLPEAMGPDSLYWCCQGISAGESLGADVVKQKFPMPVKAEKREAYFRNLQKEGYIHKMTPDISEILKLEPENPEEITHELNVRRLALMACVAPHTLKIISGGPKTKNEEGLLNTLRTVMDSGNEGQIVGRNLWGRPIEEALSLARRMNDLMKHEQYARPAV